jgi:hypothetical protein
LVLEPSKLGARVSVAQDAGSGAVGTLVSGIVLGARKRNQRLLNRSIQRRPAQGFHWDLRLGAFVF